MHLELMVQPTINQGKMRRISILSCILICASCCVMCSMKVVGTYKSTCVLYGYPDLVVTFNFDGTFVYKMRYVEEIFGTWVIKRDTLILYSERFTDQPPSESAPADKYNKYTDLEGKKDAYLVKGKKLYPINKEGHTKGCYLKKQ